VFGIDGTSWNREWVGDGVSDCFKRRHDFKEVSSSSSSVYFSHLSNSRTLGVQRRCAIELDHVGDSTNIFCKHPIGPSFRNNSEHFRPERTVILLASSLPGATERLARKSACDEIGADASNVSDVSVVGHMGPVSFEDFARIRFDFRKADCPPSGSLSGQRKPAYTGEKIQVRSTDT